MATRRLCMGITLLASTAACSAAPPAGWPAWEGFKAAFVSEDGRVIDRSEADLRTVSEGQSYALFFALVAQDRKAFDSILKWTENNLSEGDMGKQLPAWIWGKQGESWGVIDSNSASDADLWIAYALLEASRVWCHQPYADKARALGDLILSKESIEVSGLGLSILPGHTGFVLGEGAIKLNPSYLPPFMMARFADAWADDARWAHVYLASQKLLLETGASGSYPDWVLYNNGQMSLPDDEQRGDYDAIRTYMWIGMSHNGDPVTQSMLNQLSPMVAVLLKRQHMPEWFEPMGKGMATVAGPPGFQVAMAPFLQATGLPDQAKKFAARSLKTSDKENWLRYGYYNGALSLFGQGYMDNLYRFNTKGALLPRGKEVKSCG